MPGVTTAYQAGVHGSRPAAGAGCILYACSTHSLIYRSDGTTWTTWMTIGTATTTVATDAIWDAKGDLAGGTGADAAARLAVGANDTILMADSAQSTGLKWVASQTPSTQAVGDAAAEGTADTYSRGDHKHAMPAAIALPGGELDYVAFTSNVNLTATTEATANTIVTSNAITYDGSTVVKIAFFCPVIYVDAGTTTTVNLWLYEKVGAGAAASIGRLAQYLGNVAIQGLEAPGVAFHRKTPSAASIIYSIRGSTSTGTSVAGAGAGGTATSMPGFIQITKV